MKSPAKRAAWLLPFLLTGCFQLPFHKAEQAQQPPLAPPIQVSQPLELASLELPSAQTVLPGKPIYNMRLQALPIRPPVRRRKQATPEEATNNPDTAAGPASSVNALGELSSGDPANLRQQTEVSIASIERGLHGVNRTLSEPEQKIANHIREFLKQAKAALASGDVEGARTLAAKAQVLLEELTR